MNLQSKIEVNQSSLLSLKAELLRKKQEVHNAKLSDFPNRPTVVNKTKLKTKLDKANEGVSERNRKDAEAIQEESDALKKSQSILEAKSKLYDELVKDPKANSGHFLVDFKNKESEKDESAVLQEDDDKIESDFEEDDEEWVDFVDCLGRTKRCHRDDLESMKANDEKLKISLFGPSRSQESKEPEKPKTDGVELPDLCSEDMRRELLRQKWEEEERELLDKKNIHYQHVLFDGKSFFCYKTDILI
ncbi:UNVERIFIED_CONTAM: hypothetical protein PYX00_003977 [Menopon gallinae]|uniref:CCDC174 alpha/beta GRSR domain-containing protein n=1 Tax=Menopon gallinae TaxID=328185 RepID=A0AAW2I2H6_9NEOP